MYTHKLLTHQLHYSME